MADETLSQAAAWASEHVSGLGRGPSISTTNERVPFASKAILTILERT